MKNTMAYLLTCMMLFCLIGAGCLTFSADDKIQKAIPGTYFRFSEHEFGSEWDTLTIKGSNSGLTMFQIVRKWKYERVLDGQRIEPEYKRQVTSGIYDENSHFLKDTDTGNIYSFDLAKNTVSTGETIYKKIK
jgi:hypothetical protein